MSTVLYHIARIDDSNKTVYIDNVTPEYAAEHEFFCPSCGERMYATFGDIQSHHFRHNEGKCAPDHFLHDSAECTFIGEYEECLKEGEPFYLELTSHPACNRNCALNSDGRCKKQQANQLVELTKIYTKITRECRVSVGDGYRRPDILLESEAGEQLWIEIFVTHEVGEDKRQSASIVEIKISSQEDIEKFREHYIIQSNAPTVEKGIAARLVTARFDDNLVGVVRKSFSTSTCKDFREKVTFSSSPGIIFKPREQKPVSKPIPEELFNPESIEWVNLGLPSGTLWAQCDIPEKMQYWQAAKKFKDYLPSYKQADELADSTIQHRTWIQGENQLVLIGPNENTIAFSGGSQNEVYYWLKEHADLEYGDIRCLYLQMNEGIINVRYKQTSSFQSVHLCRKP